MLEQVVVGQALVTCQSPPTLTHPKQILRLSGTVVLLEVTATGVVGLLVIAGYTVEGEDSGGQGWTLYPEASRKVVSTFDKELFESVLSG